MEKMTWQQFAQSIKQKYPDYAEIDDKELAERMLAKFPDYQEAVDTTGIGGGSMEMPAKPLALQSPEEAQASVPEPSVGIVEALFPRRTQQERESQLPNTLLGNFEAGVQAIPTAVGDVASLFGRAISAGTAKMSSDKDKPFLDLLAYGTGRQGLSSLPEMVARDPATPVSLYFGGPLYNALKGLPTLAKVPAIGASEGVLQTATSQALTPTDATLQDKLIDIGIGGTLGGVAAPLAAGVPIVAQKLKNFTGKMDDLKAQRQAIATIKESKSVPDVYNNVKIQDKGAAEVYKNAGVMEYYPEITGLPKPVELQATQANVANNIVDPQAQSTDMIFPEEGVPSSTGKSFPDQDELRQVHAAHAKGESELDVPEYVWKKYGFPAFAEYRAQRQQIGFQKGQVENALLENLPSINKSEIYKVLNESLKPAGVSISFRINSQGKQVPVYRNAQGTELPKSFANEDVKAMLAKVAALPPNVSPDLVLSLRQQIDELLPAPKVSAFAKDTPQTAAIKKMRQGLMDKVYQQIDEIDDPMLQELKDQHKALRQEYAKRITTEQDLSRLIGKQIDDEGATSKGEMALKRIHSSLSNQGADILWREVAKKTGIDVHNAAAQMRVAMLENGDISIENLNELVKLTRDAQKNAQSPLSSITATGATIAGGKALVDAAKSKVAPKGGESARVLSRMKREQAAANREVVPISQFTDAEVQAMISRAMGVGSAQRSEQKKKANK
jgi:hypothetical protein